MDMFAFGYFEYWGKSYVEFLKSIGRTFAQK